LGERETYLRERERALDYFCLCCWTQNWERERQTDRIWERFGENWSMNWTWGLGSIYTKTNGQDCSKTIASNGWGEDLGRFGIKNRIFRDLVHEYVSCRSRSIDFFGGSIDTLFTLDRSTICVDRSTWIISGSIDILFIQIFFYLNLFNKLDPLLFF